MGEREESSTIVLWSFGVSSILRCEMQALKQSVKFNGAKFFVFFLNADLIHGPLKPGPPFLIPVCLSQLLLVIKGLLKSSS